MPTKKKAPHPQEAVNHRRGRLTLPDGTVLLPGANLISPETFQLIRSCDITKTWLRRGLISVRQKVEAGTVEYDLSWGLPDSIVGLNHDTIRDAVKQCADKDQLFRWLEGASDEAIRKLITERAYELTFEEAENLAQEMR